MEILYVEGKSRDKIVVSGSQENLRANLGKLIRDLLRFFESH